jgi:hypothetical protein
MPNAATAPVKYAGRNYVVECLVVAGLYVAAVALRPWLVQHTSDPSLILAAKVLPAVPIWGMFAVVWRYYRRIDEFEKQRFLETLAISFGLSSCLVGTYTVLADAGLPQLAVEWSWPTLWVTWALVGLVMHVARR